jgi:RNase P subunit RPR2
MIQATAAAAPSDTATTAPCPKCATIMVLAAITPHPIAKQMERHTFLCTKCNQTKTYMLPTSNRPPNPSSIEGKPEQSY